MSQSIIHSLCYYVTTWIPGILICELLCNIKQMWYVYIYIYHMVAIEITMLIESHLGIELKSSIIEIIFILFHSISSQEHATWCHSMHARYLC